MDEPIEVGWYWVKLRGRTWTVWYREDAGSMPWTGTATDEIWGWGEAEKDVEEYRYIGTEPSDPDRLK